VDSGGWFATGKILSAQDPARIDGTFDLVSRGGAACGPAADAWTSRHFTRATYWTAPGRRRCSRTLFEAWPAR